MEDETIRRGGGRRGGGRGGVLEDCQAGSPSAYMCSYIRSLESTLELVVGSVIFQKHNFNE